MRLKAIIIALVMLTTAQTVEAKDVHVNGYYRSNGTYVQPHIRPTPNSVKWDNYGASKNSSELMNPKARDADRDGIPNYRDHDDNNNGISDDNEKK